MLGFLVAKEVVDAKLGDDYEERTIIDCRELKRMSSVQIGYRYLLSRIRYDDLLLLLGVSAVLSLSEFLSKLQPLSCTTIAMSVLRQGLVIMVKTAETHLLGM
ncbi:PREDICTED: uncharacterized protein LOC104805323 isoform X2 [Tarenaya hassleriana]|uniref:uncharacterized protein LOC104805323 isoform X2 n=1 Tax=Tarenaya hassleriana TaxID=28532 RepID=UPI00053C4641|nr:PREDICTED: uncharacterized protein LOC104805323 isoform X2 [Tarenaya hassleriana]